MRRVAPPVIAREQLHRLLCGGLEGETNILFVLVEAVTRLVVQELLEAEQADFLGGLGTRRAPRGGPGRLASATSRPGCALPRGH
jgi:hypothetical protein